MTDAEHTAKELLAEINLPSWAVSIWPWRDTSNEIVLRVMIDPSYRQAFSDIPTVFHGYAVTTELRAPNLAVAR